MPSHRSEALTLRRVDYGERDRILTLFTREAGKVAVLARGARGSRRRFGGGALEPFTLFEASWETSPRRELGQLNEAQALRSHPNLVGDLDALAQGWRILELLDAFKMPAQVEPQLFDLALQAFAGLDQGRGLDARLIFEAGLLEQEGLAAPGLVALKERLLGGGKASPAERARLETLLCEHLGRPLKSPGLIPPLQGQP